MFTTFIVIKQEQLTSPALPAIVFSLGKCYISGTGAYVLSVLFFSLFSFLSTFLAMADGCPP